MRGWLRGAGPGPWAQVCGEAVEVCAGPTASAVFGKGRRRWGSGWIPLHVIMFEVLS